jgi:hypothetical protein
MAEMTSAGALAGDERVGVYGEYPPLRPCAPRAVVRNQVPGRPQWDDRAMWVTVLSMAVIAGLDPAGIAAIRVTLSRSQPVRLLVA